MVDTYQSILDVIYRLGFINEADLESSASWVSETELYQWADEAAQKIAYASGVFVTFDTSVAVASGTPSYSLPTSHVFTRMAWLTSLITEGSISLVASTGAYASAASDTITTPPANCAGADFLVAIGGYYAGGPGIGTVNDSSANAWTRVAGEGRSNDIEVFFAASPTVSSAQTFEYTDAETPGSPAWLMVLAFSGAGSLSQAEAVPGYSNGGPSLQPGPVSGPLAISAVSIESSSSSIPTIDSGFSVAEHVQSADSHPFSNYLTSAVAWLQASAGVNPTWTQGVSTIWDALNVAFFSPFPSSSTMLRVTPVRELWALDATWNQTAGAVGPDGLVRCSFDAGSVGTITIYPIPAANGTLAMLAEEYPPTIASGTSTVALPPVLQDYFSYVMLAGARDKESDARMEDMSAHYDQRVAMYEEIIQHLYGGGA